MSRESEWLLKEVVPVPVELLPPADTQGGRVRTTEGVERWAATSVQ